MGNAAGGGWVGGVGQGVRWAGRWVGKAVQCMGGGVGKSTCGAHPGSVWLCFLCSAALEAAVKPDNAQELTTVTQYDYQPAAYLLDQFMVEEGHGQVTQDAPHLLPVPADGVLLQRSKPATAVLVGTEDRSEPMGASPIPAGSTLHCGEDGTTSPSPPSAYIEFETLFLDIQTQTHPRVPNTPAACCESTPWSRQT